MYMCMDIKECVCVEDYAIRRNQVGYYFCTECKGNHKVGSDVGIRHMGYDLMFKTIEKSEKSGNYVEDIWLDRFNAMKKPHISNNKQVVQDDQYVRFKTNQEIFKSRKF